MFVEDDASDGADDHSVAPPLTLERLSPREHAAFLLDDVFGMGFAEIADAVPSRRAGSSRRAPQPIGGAWPVLIETP